MLAELEHGADRVQELWVSSRADEAVIARAQAQGVKVHRAGPDDLDQATGGVVHQGLVLVTRPWEADLADIPDGGVVVMLDGVEDPRNVGRAARSCVALGASGLVVEKRKSARLGPAAYKTAVGALSMLPVAQVSNLARAIEQLQERGHWVAAAEAAGSARPWDVDLSGPMVVIVGGEDRGVRRLLRDKADHLVGIPMQAKGFSLNAADAVCALLVECMRQRGG